MKMLCGYHNPDDQYPIESPPAKEREREKPKVKKGQSSRR
jgi:hypothetical protein